MKLEYRHSNGHDSIVLIDETGLAKSDWTVTPESIADFLDCSQHPDHWDDRGGNEHRGDDYGELLATRSGYALEVDQLSSVAFSTRVEFFLR